MHRPSYFYCCVLIVCGLSFNAYADPAQTGTDGITSQPYYADQRDNHFYTQVGLFWPSIDTSIRLQNKQSGTSPTLDFENDLGLQDKRALISLNLGYQFLQKHWIELGYFELNRSGERALVGSGSVGDIDYQAGAVLGTQLDIDIYQVNYGYSFYKTDQWMIGGMLGLYWYHINTQVTLNGYVHVGDSTLPLIDANENTETNRKFNAPLPTIGMHVAYNITPAWKIQTRFMWFDASVDDYSGKITNVYAGIRKNITPHIFAGFNYSIFNISVQKNSPASLVDFQYLYQGPMLYLGYQI